MTQHTTSHLGFPYQPGVAPADPVEVDSSAEDEGNGTDEHADMVAVDVNGYVVEDENDPQFDRWVPEGTEASGSQDEPEAREPDTGDEGAVDDVTAEDEPDDLEQTGEVVEPAAESDR